MTIVVAGTAAHIPGIIYWGPTLPADEDLAGLCAALTLPRAHGGLDLAHVHALFPEAGQAHFGTPGLEAFSTADGRTSRWITQFSVSAFIAIGPRLTVEAADAAAAIGLTLALELSDAGLLKARCTLHNQGSTPLFINWLMAPALPIPDTHQTLHSWHGRWCAEFQRAVRYWQPGSFTLESRTGRTSHEVFPGIASAATGITETTGQALAAHLAWSGNWRLQAEQYMPGLRQLIAGVLFMPGECVLAPGAAITTPDLLAVTSSTGWSGIADAFHSTARATVIMPRPDAPRPVHFNSWEAAYFKLDVPVLTELADRAAAVGAERFVVDDGWFKGRSDDKRALGDWTVDRHKFPDGLHPVIDHVRGLGLGFGIWVEPEMVNPDSDLMRAHPDWALGLPGLTQITGRQQLVLDLARPEVLEHIFGRLDALLTEYRIDYFKWDMNRVLTLPGRMTTGEPVAAAQTTALYALLARLRHAHPKTEIESCSSGGGRIDHGILKHVQRFWLSDNNDAHDRWRMNQEAALFFPPEVFGHHVGPSPCHTSGRELSMTFRAFSAAVGGHMGMELDLRVLANKDLDTLKAAIAFHKQWRDVLHKGVHRRLELAGPYLGASWALEDRLLVAVTQRDTLPHAAPSMVRLPGLAAGSRWNLRFAPALPIDNRGARAFISPFSGPDGLTLSAAALAATGFRLPPGWPDSLWLIEGMRAK